jgi:hypothetical protein
MNEYVEASPKARQTFFLAALLLVGAMGILTQWEGRESSRHKAGVDSVSVTEVVERVESKSFRQALFTTLGQAPFAVLGAWFGIRLIRERRWPFVGVSVPFRTRVRYYAPWQAAILAFLVAALPLAVAAYAWKAHDARMEPYAEFSTASSSQ